MIQPLNLFYLAFVILIVGAIIWLALCVMAGQAADNADSTWRELHKEETND
jgi:hypothetical protein